MIVSSKNALSRGQELELSIVSSCEHCEMPVEFHQLSTLPQSHDEPQPCLEQTQGRVAHGIDELLLARGNHVRDGHLGALHLSILCQHFAGILAVHPVNFHEEC